MVEHGYEIARTPNFEPRAAAPPNTASALSGKGTGARFFSEQTRNVLVFIAQYQYVS
jgi:hypothetical protein